jgi:olefin beta-lactone synthetase
MTGAPASTANVALLLEAAAARRRGEPAIVAPDGRVLWAFEVLAEAAARFAGGLAAEGIGEGDRVLVLEPDRREIYRAVAGIVWAGATAVLPPASLPPRAALAAAAGTSPAAVVTSLRLWPLLVPYAGVRHARVRILRSPLSVPGTTRLRDLVRHAPVGPRPVHAGSAAVLSFTTGSTGRAKPIARSHAVLRAQHDALAQLRGLDDSDRDLAGLPLLVLHNLAGGVTSIVPPRRAGSRDGGRIRAALTAGGATSAAGFPDLFETAVHGAGRGDLGRLRSIHVGGTRVRPALLNALDATVPNARTTVVYGSTEIEPIAALGAAAYLGHLVASTPEDGICVGRVIDGLDLRLEGPPEAGSRTPSAGTGMPRAALSGESTPPGRILLRGPRAASAGGLGGWVETGDAGRLDAAGRLWLLGRVANAVGDLCPVAVERVAEDLPWANRAAAVRVGHGSGAYLLVAVEPHSWSSKEERADQLTELAGALAQRELPVGDLRLVPRLPVLPGPGAKVDDARLRALAGSGVPGRVLDPLQA